MFPLRDTEPAAGEETQNHSQPGVQRRCVRTRGTEPTAGLGISVCRGLKGAVSLSVCRGLKGAVSLSVFRGLKGAVSLRL